VGQQHMGDEGLGRLTRVVWKDSRIRSDVRWQRRASVVSQEIGVEKI